MREIAMSDYATGMYTAKLEAKQEGIQIGEIRGIQIGKLE
jgi:hypothetical protein